MHNIGPYQGAPGPILSTSGTSVSSQTHIPSRVYVRTVWSDDQNQHLAGSDKSPHPWINPSHLQWAGRI